MKVVNNLLVFILLVGIWVSCKSEKRNRSSNKDENLTTIVDNGNTDSTFYELNLQEIVQQKIADFGTLNSIAQKINFIHIENKANSVVTDLNLQIDRVEGDFIVSCLRSPVLQFDSTGLYRKKLIGIGRANNEVQHGLYQWTYHNGQLNLCQGNKMIIYIPSTKSLKGYLLRQHYYNAILLKDGHYVALPYLGSEMFEQRYLDFLNSNCEVVKSLSYLPKRDIYYRIPPMYTGNLETYGLYPSYTGDALFKDIFNDTVYKVKDVNTMVPYMHLKRGDLSPSVKNVTNTSVNKGLVYVKNVAESAKFVFVNYGYQESVFCAVFCKETRKLISFTRMSLDNATSLINSKYFIDYITPKGKKVKVGILTITEDRLYCVVKTEDAIDFMSGMDEYDNPLILEVIL